MLRVNVSWNKRKFEDVELNTEQPPLEFKVLLFSLTGVQPDRQKIIVKGGLLKDDGDWSKLDVRAGQTFMMVGTASDGGAAPAPVALAPTVKFEEDLSHSDFARLAEVPPGLNNLGNTCYMNATLQCLRTIPELNTALTRFPGGSTPSDKLIVSLRDLFRDLAKGGGSMMPMMFVQLFRAQFPQFAQRSSETGGFAQQDAEECWSQLVSLIGQKINEEQDKPSVNAIMGVELVSEWKNSESAEEPATYSTEKALKVSCHINEEVNTLERGIQESLKESIEKHSSLLGRQAVYTKTTRITRLPAYLAVSFVRFFWRRDTQKKAKILRKVKFPLTLDMYEFCSEDLKKALVPNRAILHAHDEAVLAINRENKLKARDQPPKELPVLSIPRPADAACQNVTGVYELAAVLTHEGRTGDSGHYIAWVRQSDDVWWKFDDDRVSQVNTEAILRLDGGGEAPMAYQCLYRERTK